MRAMDFRSWMLTELLSKVAVIHLDQMVDPNYTVVAKISKKFLPPAK